MKTIPAVLMVCLVLSGCAGTGGALSDKGHVKNRTYACSDVGTEVGLIGMLHSNSRSDRDTIDWLLRDGKCRVVEKGTPVKVDWTTKAGSPIVIFYSFQLPDTPGVD